MLTKRDKADLSFLVDTAVMIEERWYAGLITLDIFSALRTYIGLQAITLVGREKYKLLTQLSPDTSLYWLPEWCEADAAEFQRASSNLWLKWQGLTTRENSVVGGPLQGPEEDETPSDQYPYIDSCAASAMLCACVGVG